MARLIVTEFVSADGVMQAPGGEAGYAHSGWVGPLFSPELGDFKLNEQLGADVLLLGRHTYEGFFGAWPERDGPMADKINSMPKYVASTTLTTLEWTAAQLLDGPVPQAVAALKEQVEGQILVVGSHTLVQALFAAGLIDQLNLQVFPLILGSGARVFPHTDRVTELGLTSSRALPNGVVLQTYDVTTSPSS